MMSDNNIDLGEQRVSSVPALMAKIVDIEWIVFKKLTLHHSNSYLRETVMHYGQC